MNPMSRLPIFVSKATVLLVDIACPSVIQMVAISPLTIFLNLFAIVRPTYGFHTYEYLTTLL